MQSWSGIWWSDVYPYIAVRGNVYLELPKPLPKRPNFTVKAQLRYLGIYRIGTSIEIPIQLSNGQIKPITQHSVPGWTHEGKEYQGGTGPLSFVITKETQDLIEGNWSHLINGELKSGKFQLWPGPNNGEGAKLASFVQGVGSALTGFGSNIGTGIKGLFGAS